jgi:dual-specificity kinase
MACILVELYSGEMMFPTHENVEHLGMIQKECGPFPTFMA